MDWWIQLSFLVVGYLVLGLSGKKRQNPDSDSVLPIHVKKPRTHAEIEKESQEIVKRALSKQVPSYKEITSSEIVHVRDDSSGNAYFGFMEYYLSFTTNEKELTSTADHDIMKTLAKNDLLLD